MKDRIKSLSEIAEQQYDSLYKYCLKKTGGDEQMAGECAAEAFLRAKKLGDPPLHPNISGWLRRTASNVAHEKLREKKRYEKRNVSLERLMDEDVGSLAPFLRREAEFVDELFASAAEPDDDDILRMKREILEMLPPADRELMVLAYEKKLSPREIAELTGKSKDAIRVKLARLTDKVTVMVRNRFDNE